MATTAAAPAAALHREGPSTFAAAGALGPESPAETVDTATDPAAVPAAGCCFDGLDDHVLLQILSRLEPRDALNLRRTARRFYRALSGVLPLTDFVAHAVRSIDAELQFQDLHAFRHGTDIVHVEQQLAALSASGLANVAAAYALAVAKQVLDAERVARRMVTLTTGDSAYQGGLGHLWLFGMLYQFADHLPFDLTILLVNRMDALRKDFFTNNLHTTISANQIGLRDLLRKLSRLGIGALSGPEQELRRRAAACGGTSTFRWGWYLQALLLWSATLQGRQHIVHLVDSTVWSSTPRRAFVVLHWARHYAIPCSIHELLPKCLEAGNHLQSFTFDDKRLIVRWLFADAELKRLCASVITSWVMAHGGNGPWSITS